MRSALDGDIDPPGVDDHATKSAGGDAAENGGDDSDRWRFGD